MRLNVRRTGDSGTQKLVVDFSNPLLDIVGMTLGEYLTNNAISAATFAASVGCSSEAVRLWSKGLRVPRSESIRKISELTHGAVRPADWFAEAA